MILWLVASVARAWSLDDGGGVSAPAGAEGVTIAAHAGAADVVAVGKKQTWLLDGVDGHVIAEVDQGGHGVAAIDLDGDGLVDLVVCGDDGLWGIPWKADDTLGTPVSLGTDACTAVAAGIYDGAPS